MFMPSTYTRSSRGATRMTRPVLPRSLPAMTSTWSSVLIFIVRRWGVGREGAMSEHLGSEGDDLHEVAVAQLAGHRAEDARPARVVLVIDDHRGILVEGDVG